MKKEMWGFLGIFLLVSMGFASAGWFDWITGNVVDENLSNQYFYTNFSVNEDYFLNNGQIVTLLKVYSDSVEVSVDENFHSIFFGETYKINGIRVQLYSSFYNEGFPEKSNAILGLEKTYENPEDNEDESYSEFSFSLNSEYKLNNGKVLSIEDISENSVNLVLNGNYGTINNKDSKVLDGVNIKVQSIGYQSESPEDSKVILAIENSYIDVNQKVITYSEFSFSLNSEYKLNNGKVLSIEDISENSVKVQLDLVISTISKGEVISLNGVNIKVQSIGYQSESPEKSKVILGIDSSFVDSSQEVTQKFSIASETDNLPCASISSSSFLNEECTMKQIAINYDSGEYLVKIISLKKDISLNEFFSVLNNIHGRDFKIYDCFLGKCVILGEINSSSSFASWINENNLLLIAAPLSEDESKLYNLIKYYYSIYPSELGDYDNIYLTDYLESNPVDFKVEIEKNLSDETTLFEEEGTKNNFSNKEIFCQLGYRQNGSYCNLEGVYVTQKFTDSDCDNNFECESNLCIDSKCVEVGLWTKFMNWLKSIFG